MEIYVLPEGRMGLRDLSPIEAELLRLIPRWADVDCEAVDERFYPAPSGDPEEDDLRDDWKAHVQPDLHAAFLSARDIVTSDLRAMHEVGDDVFDLEFPRQHADAWISAVNQARLALAARHDIDEEGMARRHHLVELKDERDLALLQIDFYDMVLHWFIDLIDR